MWITEPFHENINRFNLFAYTIAQTTENRKQIDRSHNLLVDHLQMEIGLNLLDTLLMNNLTTSRAYWTSLHITEFAFGTIWNSFCSGETVYLVMMASNPSYYLAMSKSLERTSIWINSAHGVLIWTDLKPFWYKIGWKSCGNRLSCKVSNNSWFGQGQKKNKTKLDLTEP